MHKIGLTGVTGHLGTNILQHLTESRTECKLLLRRANPFYNDKNVVIGDLSNHEILHAFTKDCTAVVHCAGMVWPKKGRNPEVIEVNVEGTKRLFQQCKKNGVQHFVYVSSIHSMDIPSTALFDENAPLTTNKTKAYDFSKAEVERYLSKQKGIKITTINPTAIIGPGDRNLRSINQLFYLFFNDKLPMVTSGGFYVIDVRTVTEAIMNAVLLGETGKYIIGGKYFSIKELVAIYGDVNGMDSNKVAMPAWLMKLMSISVKPIEPFLKKPLPLNSYAVETLLNVHPNITSDKALNDLKLTHIPIEKSLEDLHEWFTNKMRNE